MPHAYPLVFSSVGEILRAVGTDLGTSEWSLIDQQRINAFADVTGDHQWIHVDEGRAGRSPFGSTIAHGYLTLSMLSAFAEELFEIRGVDQVVNYGLNTVRFPAPVRVNSRIRAHGSLNAAVPSGAGLKVIVGMTVEIEGTSKPACVAETVTWVVPQRLAGE